MAKNKVPARSNRIKKHAKHAKHVKRSNLRKRGLRPVRPAHKNLYTVQENLGQITESKFTVISANPHPGAKMMKLLGAPQYFNYSNVSGTCSTTAIGQAVYRSDILTSQIELSRINDATLGFAGLINTVSAPTRFLLESLRFEREIQNQSNVPCTVDFYLIKAKRDTWASTTTPMVFTASSGTQYTWPLGTPQQAIQAGYASQTNSLTTDNKYLNPAVYPDQVDLFNQYFSIVKHEKIDLALGGIHKLHFSIIYNKVADGSVFGNTPLVSVNGFTYFVLMRASGSVATDTTAGGVGVLAPATLSFVDQRSYKYTQLWTPIIASVDQNLNPSSTGDVLDAMNPGSGTITSFTHT